MGRGTARSTDDSERGDLDGLEMGEKQIRTFVAGSIFLY